MDPEFVVRLANWFRLKATNNNITDPIANENHPRFPEFENIKGTISAAVIVGEMSAIFWASSSMKLRQLGLSWDSLVIALTFSFPVRAFSSCGFFFVGVSFRGMAERVGLWSGWW